MRGLKQVRLALRQASKARRLVAFSVDMDKSREERIELVRQRLLRDSLPRIQVSLILSLTGLAAFLTSFSLLHLGVTWMWLRYPIVVSFAYCFFLLLLAFWLWLQRRNLDSDLSVLDHIPSGPGEHGDSFQFDEVRDFDGGGAGGSWGESASSLSSQVSGDSTASQTGDLDLDLGDGWLIVVAIVALIGGLIASFYIIYIAPALLAEILVDGALAIGLYRRVKPLNQRHWLRAAIRKTILPAVLVALFLTVAGYALQKAIPGAHTMGEVWNHLMRS
jgi:hypothetical protein